jgi:hypothetical protein
MKTARIVRVIAVGVCGLLLSGGGGCESTKIAMKEMVGIAKRDQLVARVKDTKESQEAAKVQFESALAEFIAVTGVKPGDLEAQYAKMKKAADASETRAKAVSERISATDTVATKLFKEWEGELAQYQNAEMRSASEKQLTDTKTQYATLLGKMKAAEGKMTPVLGAFKDQVLFLKHNLNARAVASLSDTVRGIEGDVATLIAEMNASIAEANTFIEQMGT